MVGRPDLIRWGLVKEGLKAGNGRGQRYKDRFSCWSWRNSCHVVERAMWQGTVVASRYWGPQSNHKELGSANMSEPQVRPHSPDWHLEYSQLRLWAEDPNEPRWTTDPEKQIINGHCFEWLCLCYLLHNIKKKKAPVSTSRSLFPPT